MLLTMREQKCHVVSYLFNFSTFYYFSELNTLFLYLYIELSANDTTQNTNNKNA